MMNLDALKEMQREMKSHQVKLNDSRKNLNQVIELSLVIYYLF